MTPQCHLHVTFMLLLRDGQSDHCSDCQIFLTVSPNPLSASFFFCFSIPYTTFIPSICNISQGHASFFQHSLHPFKMCTCATSFLFSSCSCGFFCPRGRDHHFKCQTLKGFTINMDMPTISLTKTTPLLFLSPDCGRLRPSISRQTCGPTSWHLTEVMVINQDQITHTVIQYCWKRWDWVLWLLVVYERAFLKYYCTWKTPVNTV